MDDLARKALDILRERHAGPVSELARILGVPEREGRRALALLEGLGYFAMHAGCPEDLEMFFLRDADV
jgi:DNA-binding IclR family transcriptional regulator